MRPGWEGEAGHALRGHRGRSFDEGDTLRVLPQLLARRTLEPVADFGRRRDPHAGVDFRRHFAGGRVPLVRVPLEPSEHDAIEGLRQLRHDGTGCGHRRAQHVRQDIRLVGGLEEALPGQDLPEDDRGRIDIGSASQSLAADLLGGHVGELALELAVASRLQSAGGLRHAEVQQARDPVGADDGVLRRHVAMHEIEALAEIVPGFVGCVQPLEHSAHNPECDARRNSLAAVSRCARKVRQGDPPDVLHDDEYFVVHVDDVERRNDVGMGDARREPRLIEEHLDEIRVARELGVEALDRDGPREAHGPHESPEMHRRHAARRNFAVQQVSADHARAGRK